MNQQVKKEVEDIIQKLDLNCSVEEFQNKVNWSWISYSQNLSEPFIREFQDKVNWLDISYSQKLSESFIREFQDKVDWSNISKYQKLSEPFIREFQSKVDWSNISYNQKLSKPFIREFQDKVNWLDISYSQKLSEPFIREFQDKLNVLIQRKKHENKSLEQRLEEIKSYAKKHNLVFDGKFLFAFREHDQFGRGQFNKTISYEAGKYYQDWHCDMDEQEENSFGLGIWPKGNTPIKVKVEDWGVEVGGDRQDGKARVFGFEVLG